MYISKLSLYGFKSFLKKSDVVFDKGITCIVGPNGCGKTNIVDAIRWVIGEQKSSVLRADRNTDVIFNGTATRRPVNLAEVSLTIHNVSGKVPIDYTDIVISRRVYRNGESEYFINNNLCRLKDITDLFIDTGMGANAYSIIELKMIEDILSESPDERKRLFEEAAGVNKYRVQRKAALRKLGATQDDLTRLNDIIGEVSSKVKSLKRQLRRYEKYQETTKKLVQAESRLAARRIYQLQTLLSPIEEELQQKQSKSDQVKAELAEQEAAFQKQQEQFNIIENDLQTKSGSLEQLKTQKNELQTENLLLNEQIHNVDQQIKRLEKNIDNASQEINRVKSQKEHLREELSAASVELEKRQDLFKHHSQEYEKIDQQVQKISSELGDLRDQRYGLVKEQAKYSAQYDHLEENIQQREAELSSVEQQLNQKQTQLRRLNAAQADLQQEREQISSLLASVQTDLEQTQQQHADLIRQEQDLLAEQRTLESKADKLANKIEFYQGIIESKEGYSPGLQYVLDNLQEFPGVKGALSDLLSVDPKYYLAVEAVIKDISRMVIAENRSAALSTLDKLADLGKGRISIIPLDLSFNGQKGPSVDHSGLKPLSDFISCSTQLAPLKNFLFQGVFTCSDSQFNELIRSSQLTEFAIVSDKGRLRDSSGFLSGGSVPAESNVIIGRSQKLYELEKQSDQIERENQALSSQLKQLRKNIEQTLTEQQKQQQAHKTHTVSLRDKEEELRAVEQEKGHINSLLDNLKENRVNIQVALDNFKERLSRKDPEATRLTGKIQSLEHRIEDKNREYEKIEQHSNQENQNLQHLRIELIKQENKYRNIKDSLAAADKRVTQLEKERAAALQEKEDDLSKKTEVEHQLAENHKKLSASTHKVDQASANLEKVRRQYQSLRAQMQNLNETIYQSRHTRDILADKIKRAELEQSKYIAREQEIRSVLSEKYEQTLPEKIEGELPSEEAAQQKVQRLKRRIEKIGMVNMAVKDEYETEADRLGFLEEQRDDLLESETTLQQVISQIDKIARQQYTEIFAKIKQNFKRTFAIFFDGGDADLKLVGDEDPLEANIEIFACPSGKRMQSLKMLSAGEKALTAIALLFGIYQVKPSPFCILDEVDAPLDDKNTQRFTNVIKTFAQETQFIMVTHNKLTMNVADSLYGVTMGEQGVSQIVSVKLD